MAWVGVQDGVGVGFAKCDACFAISRVGFFQALKGAGGAGSVARTQAKKGLKTLVGRSNAGVIPETAKRFAIPSIRPSAIKTASSEAAP